MFIGLNPSTADQYRDDPTIRRVSGFAAKWGYGGFYMMNLFAWVTPYPEELKKSSDPIGDNDEWLLLAASKCDKIVFAWGSFPEAADRSKAIVDRFTGFALAINKDGSPRHPLYVKSDTELVSFFKQ